MLNRKAFVIMSVLTLVMLASDIWQVTQTVRWSATLLIGLFGPPVLMMMAVRNCVRFERDVVASGEVLAARTKWGSAMGISVAVIFTVIQLLPIVPSLGISSPTSELIWRLFVAGCGLPFVVIGNRTPKLLSPVKWRRPGVLFAGTAEQLATSRLTGWLLVSLGVTMIGSALFLSRPMMVIAGESVGFAALILVLVNLFRLMVTKLRRAAK